MNKFYEGYNAILKYFEAVGILMLNPIMWSRLFEPVPLRPKIANFNALQYNQSCMIANL